MPDGSPGVARTCPTTRAAPILLGGDHRSGTTLVSLVLDTHPDVVFGPELDFRLPVDLGAHLVACCDRELAGDPAVAGRGVTTTDPQWQLGIQFVRQCRRFGIDAASLRALALAEMRGGARLVDFAERAALIDRIGEARRSAVGVDRWGFKIQRDIVDAGRFLEQWPDALFVHVVRDGRDVAASHLTSDHEWTYRSADEAAHGWVGIMTGVPRHELGDRLHELRYEDLVRRPEPVLRALMAFLGLPWDDGVLRHEVVDHELARHPYDHPSVEAATRPIDAAAVGRSTNDLPSGQVARFEAIAGTVLRVWGYALEAGMRIGIVISDIALARPVDTSLVLALEAVRLGHEVSIFGIGDLALAEHDGLSARATTMRILVPPTTAELHAQLSDASQGGAWIDVGDLDLLLLRADPNEGPGARTWSQQASIRLGRLAVERGVDVVNDPAGLLLALDKSYILRLPPELLPRSLVSRDLELLRAFVEELGGPAVVKPVSGAGGRRVFRAEHSRDANLAQFLDLAAEDGYVMVQEYVAAAAAGTPRVFLVGGAPLVVRGRHAALRHCPGPHDHRSNIHAGGSVAPARLSGADVRAAEVVAPLLARDGLVIAGLDLAGGKVLEVNVFSPGGMFGIERFEGPGFATAVVDYLVSRQASRAG